MKRLIGTTALITGGARGIGRGIASRFLEEGASVILLDVRENELMEASAALSDSISEQQQQQHPNQQQLPEAGEAPQVFTIVCDLADPEQIEAAAEQAWSLRGGIDILINNAGIAVREPFIEIPYARWKSIMDVNVNAMFLLSQSISRRMIEHNKSGSIVNMASKNGLAGSGMLAHYNASKGAVVLLTQSMAVELAPHGIRVNAVAPGFIDTPLDRELKANETSGESLVLTTRTPMGRLGTIEETANAFLFLASSEASYITGSTLVVDGGHLASAGDF